MDCFLLEGPKILYRIALALVHLFTKSRFFPQGNKSEWHFHPSLFLWNFFNSIL